MFLYIIKKIINNPKLSIFISLFFSLFFSLFIYKLTIDTSAQSLLLEDDKDFKIYQNISKTYGNDNFLIIAFKNKENNPFLQKNIDTLKNLQKDIEKIQSVQRVFSIINAPLLQSSNNKSLKEILSNLPNITDKDINLTKAIKEINSHPFYKNNIISKDGKSVALIIYLKPDLEFIKLLNLKNNAKNLQEKNIYEKQLIKHKNIQKIKNKNDLELIKNTIKKYQDKNNSFYISGVDIIADEMINYIKKDLFNYNFILLFILALMLYVFFKNIYFVILPLFIAFINLACVSGIFGLLNFNISIVSSNYISFILIINLAISIHLINQFLEYKRKYKDINNVILLALLKKIKPSFYSILTTAIGFLSLIFSDIKPIIDLGIMMSIGIFISLIFNYIYIASFLSLIKNVKIKNKSENLAFLNFCINASLNHKKIIYLSSFIIIVLSIFGIYKLKVENSFINYFKDDSLIKQGLVFIDDNFGGTMPLDIIINFKEKQEEKQDLDSFESEFEQLSKNDTYWLNSSKIQIINKIQNYINQNPYIGSSLSIYNLLELGKILNNNKNLDDFTIALLNNNLPQDFKQILIKPYANIEQNELRFSLRIIDSNQTLKRNEFLQNINEDLKNILKNDNVDLQISGIMILYNNVLQSLFNSQFKTLFIVVFCIFVLFILIFKSFKYAFVALISNLIPLNFVFAIMGFLNIPLDIMSITISAIAIGLGVDDSIHYIYRFKKELKKYPIKEAIKISHLNIGSALYYTSICIMLGFSIMLSSNFIPSIYFAILIILTMGLLLFGTLLLLPALLCSFIKRF